MRVLIIEDDFEICGVLIALMPTKEVMSVLTLGEGIEILKRYKFDIVVLDGHLPDTKNAAETIKRFTAEFPEMPYVIISGDKELETIQNGALDFILKPSVNNIDRILDNAIKKNEAKTSASIKDAISEIKQIAQELKSIQ